MTVPQTQSIGREAVHYVQFVGGQSYVSQSNSWRLTAYALRQRWPDGQPHKDTEIKGT